MSAGPDPQVNGGFFVYVFKILKTKQKCISLCVFSFLSVFKILKTKQKCISLCFLCVCSKFLKQNKNVLMLYSKFLKQNNQCITLCFLCVYIQNS